MKLNHVNLTVTDVAAAADFLEKYFGLHKQSGRNKAFIALFDDDYSALAFLTLHGQCNRAVEINLP